MAKDTAKKSAGETSGKKDAGGKKDAKVQVYHVKEEMRKCGKKADGWVRKHPWQSVGIAAGVGAFFAWLMRRR